MPNYLPMSKDVFDLLCVQAEAGRSIDLSRAGLRATFEQARMLVTLIDGAGTLSLRNEGYDDPEMAQLRLLGCRWVEGSPSDRPQTPPTDQQPTW